MTLFRRVFGACTARPVRAIWKIGVGGLQNLPRGGGAVLVSNHLSVADPIVIMSTVPRPVTFWAKEDFWQARGFKGRIGRGFMNGLGAIRVERTDDVAGAVDALAAAVSVLRRGGLMCVFAEGTRSPDGRLYRGRTGAARLAVAAGVPLVPVALKGTERVQAIGERMPSLRRGVITVDFGVPIDPPSPAEPADHRTFRRVTETAMAAVGRLSGQESVPAFAPLRNDDS